MTLRILHPDAFGWHRQPLEDFQSNITLPLVWTVLAWHYLSSASSDGSTWTWGLCFEELFSCSYFMMSQNLLRGIEVFNFEHCLWGAVDVAPAILGHLWHIRIQPFWGLYSATNGRTCPITCCNSSCANYICHVLQSELAEINCVCVGLLTLYHPCTPYSQAVMVACNSRALPQKPLDASNN